MAKIDVDTLMRDFWENRSVGIETMPLDFISPETLAYLRECYPYLQVISMQAKFEESVIPQFKKSSCGWVIHDYGQAMSSSSGHYLHGERNPDLIKKGETQNQEGDGTLVLQTVDTAKAMVALAIEKGWPGIEIISGTELMQWAAWLAAQDKNYPLVGYTPTTEEEKKLERIRRIRSEREMAEKRAMQPGREIG
jgi:hypothetical protein